LIASLSPACAPQLAQLYGDHHSWLLGWLRRKLGCTHQAADLAQDTFLRLIHAQLHGLTHAAELREPRAFLATVAGRLVANHFRRLSLEQAWIEALAALPEASWPSPDQQAIARQALQRIDGALAALSGRARQAFLLSQFDGLTYAQIAAELDVTARSVKRYMAQAFEACILATE
jgi:RNA polymerase sigma factor (sigma-70 family)